jgi:hypothetical protein
MAEVVIHCLTEPGTDADEAAAELEAYLEQTEGVAPVLVEVEQPRVGLAEILAIIQVVSGVVDLVQKLSDFIKSRQEAGKVKEIEVEIDGERLPINKLTEEQRAKLLAAIAPETG